MRDSFVLQYLSGIAWTLALHTGGELATFQLLQLEVEIRFLRVL